MRYTLAGIKAGEFDRTIENIAIAQLPPVAKWILQ